MALANEPTLIWQSTCARSMLRIGTGLWLLHLSRSTALVWPGHTLVFGYMSGCNRLWIIMWHWLDFMLYWARMVNFVLALFSLWIIESSPQWRNVPDKLKERKLSSCWPLELARLLKGIFWKLKSFFVGARDSVLKYMQLPFDCATIAIHLSHCFQQSNSSASLALVYSAVKLLHTFVPIRNPLDNDFCRNILESAELFSGKPVSKKTPISADIKLIIDSFAGPQCSL